MIESILKIISDYGGPFGCGLIIGFVGNWYFNSRYLQDENEKNAQAYRDALSRVGQRRDHDRPNGK